MSAADVTHSTAQVQARQARRNRWMGLLVLAAILLPMAAAYFVFKTGIGMPTGTVNHGQLLQPPRPVTELTFTDSRGQTVDLLAGDKKWRMLIPARAECDKACRQTLYLTRQVHIRLAEKAHRVERVYVNFDHRLNAEAEAFLSREHPRLQQLYLPFAQWQQWLSNTNTPENPAATHHYFLVDQKGFAMMFYSPSHTGEDLLEDLKRLLKYSYED